MGGGGGGARAVVVPIHEIYPYPSYFPAPTAPPASRSRGSRVSRSDARNNAVDAAYQASLIGGRSRGSRGSLSRESRFNTPLTRSR
jgi:hypothetical protein